MNDDYMIDDWRCADFEHQQSCNHQWSIVNKRTTQARLPRKDKDQYGL